jgi:small subunit ribosomal protein S18
MERQDGEIPSPESARPESGRPDSPRPEGASERPRFGDRSGPPREGSRFGDRGDGPREGSRFGDRGEGSRFGDRGEGSRFGDRGGGRFGGRGRDTRRRKVCAFCVDHVIEIDYKDVSRLHRYLSDRGKIEPRRKTGTCARHQRRLSVALKNARHMALLPYTAAHRRGA